MLLVSSSSVQRLMRAVARVMASFDVSQTVLLASGPLIQSGKPYPEAKEVHVAIVARNVESRRRPYAI